jgi:tryptophan-rich sensory protein
MLRNPLRLTISLLLSFAAAGLGSLATYPNIGTWYAGLDKPALNPPNWVFGPVWTTLYIAMAIALYLYWGSKGTSRTGFVAFGIQLALNILWSVVFFGLHSPAGGLGIIAALWLAIAATIYLFGKASRPSAYLLVPYLAWVSFATYLNAGIALLN